MNFDVRRVLSALERKMLRTKRSDNLIRSLHLFFGVLCLLSLHVRSTHAQTKKLSTNSQGAFSLPDAPSAAVPEQKPAEPSIAGELVDPSGKPVTDAVIVLRDSNGREIAKTLSSEKGHFALYNVGSGTVLLNIEAQQFAAYATTVTVVYGESLNLQPITLGLMNSTTIVEVRATQVEVAQAQLKIEEKQRVLGIVPNFYTSYIWDAAPLRTRQKFDLALHVVSDPVQFASAGVIAGLGQATNQYPAYGQGSLGYAKRYGAAYADMATGKIIGAAIASLAKQDPRYFYRGSGSVRERALYAMSRSVIARGDRGQAQFNYSHVLSSFAAGALANSYHPASDRGVGLTISNGFIDIGANAAENLVREFFSRKFTSNIPDYVKGKR